MTKIIYFSIYSAISYDLGITFLEAKKGNLHSLVSYYLYNSGMDKVLCRRIENDMYYLANFRKGLASTGNLSSVRISLYIRYFRLKKESEYY